MRTWPIFLALACTSPEPGDPGPTDTDVEPPTVDTADTGPTTPPGPSTPVIDEFVVGPPLADVLFVIDGSFSMGTNVEVLLGSIEGLVATWDERGILYQAGATDIDEGPAQGVLTSAGGFRWAEPTQPEPANVLRQLIDEVGDPSSTEAGRMAAYRALKMTEPDMPNEGFLREGSEIVIIILTDETDQSPNKPVTAKEFVDYLLGLRPDPSLVGLHVIASTTEYADLSAALGGVAWSVDNQPYGPVLDAITETIEPRNDFTLSGTPVPESITALAVEPDGTEVAFTNEELVYDAETNRVDLDTYVPEPDTVVTVTWLPAE